MAESEEKQDKNTQDELVSIDYYNNKFYAVNGSLIPQYEYIKLKDLKTFKTRDDDVWIASYPKSGTTWIQEIVYLILNDCDFEKAKAKTLEERSPYFEYPTQSASYVDNLESPRLIKTHLPIQFLPENIINKCKIIYILRNPKDVIVSYYFFQRKVLINSFSGELKDMITLFKRGTISLGPWWKHVDGYGNSKNVFVVSYEQLYRETKETIKSLCNYLGKELTESQIDSIVEWCSFDKMKNNPSVNFHLSLKLGFFKKDGNFYRKGKIGDWINHFTPEESIEFDKVVEENLKYAANFDYGVSDEELKHFLESISLNDNSNSSDSSDNASTPASSEYHASTDIPSSSASSSLEASPSQVESSSAADASSSVAHPVSSDAQEASSSNEQPSQPVTVTSSESSEPSEK